MEALRSKWFVLLVSLPHIINNVMLKNKKRVRADSGEIIEHVAPLPPRAQPARPVEYVLFQPKPPLPKSQTQETEEAGTVDSENMPEEDDKTRVCI